MLIAFRTAAYAVAPGAVDPCSDTEADPGVLPTAEEQQEFGACIVRIAGSRHNDMYDGGSVALKARMTELIRRFVSLGADGKPQYAFGPESLPG